MVDQIDVEFGVEGNVTLRGWLFVPDTPGPRQAITMAHGYAGIREHGLDRFARVFADAGFVVLVHDHRGFGASDGEPRVDVDGAYCSPLGRVAPRPPMAAKACTWQRSAPRTWPVTTLPLAKVASNRPSIPSS